MRRQMNVWVAVIAFMIAGTSNAWANDPQGPPCTEDACLMSCQQYAANFALPEKQPTKPPVDGLARCITVGIQEGGDDGCEYVDHTACDCDATAPQPGVTQNFSGLPLSAMKADAPAGTCVRGGELPGSCLMRAEDVKCALNGDGADCKAACDLLRTRIDAELPRSQTVTLDGSGCAMYETCSCIVQFEGKCFGVPGEVACGSSPKAVYDKWIAAEQEKEFPRCDAGCHCATVSTSQTSWVTRLSLFSLASLGLLRFKRRRRQS